MNIQPPKLLKIRFTNITINASWNNDDGTSDPFIGNAYRWNVNLIVTPQTHSSHTSTPAYSYNGTNVVVGDWISSNGFSWKIVSINSTTIDSISCIIEDEDRYNTFLSPSQNGDGSPANNGDGFLFSVADSGLPILSPTNDSWQIDILSRFIYRNTFQTKIRVTQPSHNFNVGNLITLQSDGKYVKSTGKVIGQINEINVPDRDHFTYIPFGRIIRNISPSLPGNIGDIIYVDQENAGEYTTVRPENDPVAIFVKISNDIGVLIS